MKEICTDYWSILMPEEWFAEQDEETIVIADNDDVSVIEITTIVPPKGSDVSAMMTEIAEQTNHKTLLAGLDAFYYDFEDDGMFWREWVCDAETVVIVISHGCELENKTLDDAAVDEILSTLALALEMGE